MLLELVIELLELLVLLLLLLIFLLLTDTLQLNLTLLPPITNPCMAAMAFRFSIGIFHKSTILPGGILTCCINPNGLNNVCKVGSETSDDNLQQTVVLLGSTNCCPC